MILARFGVQIELGQKTRLKRIPFSANLSRVGVGFSYAYVVFIVIKKVVGSMQNEGEAKPVDSPKQEVLLGGIRDLLKKG